MAPSLTPSVLCSFCHDLVRQHSAGQLETHLDLRAGLWCAGGHRPRISRLVSRRFRWLRLLTHHR